MTNSNSMLFVYWHFLDTQNMFQINELSLNRRITKSNLDKIQILLGCWTLSTEE